MESNLIRGIGIAVDWLTVMIVGQALMRIFLRMRHGLWTSDAVDGLKGVVGGNWWSSSSWSSGIPQPKSLISAKLADPIVDVWQGGALAGLWFLIRKTFLPQITIEQLTISAGLGLQVRWLAGERNKFVKFIPIEKIEDAAVVEAFQNMRVVTILCIVLKGEDKTIVPFRHTLPYEEDLFVIQDAICDLINLE